MSLLEEFGRTCVLMESVRASDGEGGYRTVWTEGIEFLNYKALDTSVEMRRAEREGVTSTYSVLINKDVPLRYQDIFKETDTGNLYRVTSNPEDKRTPNSASIALKYCTAEKIGGLPK